MTRRVLVVGAGIGGLTLAHALRRRGLSVRVLERATSWRPVGAGIALGVNAMNLLDQLGPGARIRAAGQAILGGRITDEQECTLQTFDYGAFAAYGQAVALHRGDLHDALLDGVDDLVQLGTTVSALVQDGAGVTATLSTGGQERYDAVIGADGVRSGVRALTFGPTEPRYAGYTSWRFVLPHSLGVRDSLELWGRGRRLGLVPIGQGRLYGFATLNRAEGAPDPVQGRAKRLRQLFATFSPLATRVLAAVQDEQVLQTDLHEVVLPHWTFGRVALLGDAAHAMTPNLGQGAGMSIEDAVVLARLLATGGEVAPALAAFERHRRRRVERVQRQARVLGRIGQLQAAPLVTLRSLALRATPEQVTRRHLDSVLTGERAIEVRT